jgi:hypothetical protein
MSAKANRDRGPNRLTGPRFGPVAKVRHGILTSGFAACLALMIYGPCSADPAQPGSGPLLVYSLLDQDPGRDQTGPQAAGSAIQESNSANAISAEPDQDAGDRQSNPAVRHDHPTSGFQFDYYRDSGGNGVFTLTSLTEVSVGPATFTLRREKVAASGPHGDEGSEATAVSGYGKPWNWLLVGGGIGVIRTQDGSSSLAGSLTSSIDVASMSITLGASRGLLEANAQTIAHHVMQTDLNVSIWDDITDDLGTDVEFHHRIFSDGNSENDFSLDPQYSIKIWKTKLALDWSFEYANFARPTTLGYYAPQGLLTDEPAISWKFDRAGYYGLFKVGAGRMFDLYQSQWKPSFSGTGVAAFGKRLSERIVAECYLTAGRDALGVPSAWSSMNTGFKLNYSF